MSPRALICAAAAAVMACALPAAPGRAQEVEAAPRRMLSAHEQMAFRGIGRLDFGDGYCTATLFDDRHALTAAHCLFDEAGRRRPSAGMWFRAGLRDGTQQAVRQVRRAVPHPAYRWNGRLASASDIAVDVAMVELDQPLLTSEFPNYLPGDLPPPVGAVALLSYGQGRDRALSLQEPCRVLQRAGPVAQLDCEADPGSSGSPVLTRGPDGALRLAGVISAKGRRLSYASAVSDTLPGLRQAMAAADVAPRRALVPLMGAPAAGSAPMRAAPVPRDEPETRTLLPNRAGGWKSVRPPSE